MPYTTYLDQHVASMFVVPLGNCPSCPCVKTALTNICTSIHRVVDVAVSLINVSISTCLGVVLVQECQLVAYASQALARSLQNYTRIDKELQKYNKDAGCSKFYQYFMVARFQQRVSTTVHASFKYHFIKHNQYCSVDNQITYKPGKLMFLTDTVVLLAEYIYDRLQRISMNQI